MTESFLRRYHFFRQHAGGVVGQSAQRAWCLAKAVERAEELDLVVVWEDESMLWDGEGEPPRLWMVGLAYKRADVNEYEGRARRGATSYAALGGVGADSFRDPFVKVCEAEILAEALAELDKEFQEEANRLAERPTYAMMGTP